MVASFYWRLFIPGAFDRWELIQAQELHKKLRIKQNLQQLNSDISDITTWLKKTEAELETFKMAEPPSDMREMELRVKRLKVNGGGARGAECGADARSAHRICRGVGGSLHVVRGGHLSLRFTSVTGKDTDASFSFRRASTNGPKAQYRARSGAQC